MTMTSELDKILRELEKEVGTYPQMDTKESANLFSSNNVLTPFFLSDLLYLAPSPPSQQRVHTATKKATLSPPNIATYGPAHPTATRHEKTRAAPSIVPTTHARAPVAPSTSFRRHPHPTIAITSHPSSLGTRNTHRTTLSPPFSPASRALQPRLRRWTPHPPTTTTNLPPTPQPTQC
ncbi:hypothetical protein BC938DRAFT_473501 [Jimgerdemannia flammicorona]|uniref:Uncharacterized protein n=1 Tax=Jimgerdemannia flammicorona TaxID=994334 RepID=A0A433Q3W4_9FUNG|nr:hypothetical protein BC938DRAFT_473501 [Jimgerdemannia flammicorona]